MGAFSVEIFANLRLKLYLGRASTILSLMVTGAASTVSAASSLAMSWAGQLEARGRGWWPRGRCALCRSLRTILRMSRPG